MILELAGIPRSGKSTLIQTAKLDYTWKHEEEFFDEVPFPESDHANYNLWYANKLVSKLDTAIRSAFNYAIQRGAFDRIVFAESLKEHNFLAQGVVNFHKAALEKYIYATHCIVVCECSVETSMKRDPDPNPLTGSKDFLETLRINYIALGKHYGAKFINTNNSPEKALEQFLSVTGVKKGPPGNE
jgi:hypothetical protein